MRNEYIPTIAEIIETKNETPFGPRMVKSIKISVDGKTPFRHMPGQCAMLSHFGSGESMISIACPPNDAYLEFSILLQGFVTTGIHFLDVGEKIGVRGPYGNYFPVKKWMGKNIVIIGGGIGIAPLRSLYGYIIQHREDYGDVEIIYGARTSSDLVYKEELFELMKRNDVKVHLSIDKQEDDWKHYVGFVPNNLIEVSPSPKNSIAVTCGPPIMIKFVIRNLKELNFNDDQIYTTLERKMKCGIGKCGRCNIGEIYVCRDGPVFSYSEIKRMKSEV